LDGTIGLIFFQFSFAGPKKFGESFRKAIFSMPSRLDQGDTAMKRHMSFFAVACFVLCLVSSASADYQIPMICTDSGFPVTVATLDVVTTPITSPLGIPLEKLEVYIADWLTMSDDKLITSFDAKFSTLNTIAGPQPGKGFALYVGSGGTSTVWQSRTTMLYNPDEDTYGPRPSPQTFMSFTTKIDGASWNRTEAVGTPDPATGYKMYSEFTGAWYSGNSDNWVGVRGYPGNNGRPFVTLYLSPGACFSFIADGAPHGIGTQGGTFGHVRFGTWPEPGTIMMLASGLVCMLGYGWRKRRSKV
jgi:hypothetical protein